MTHHYFTRPGFAMVWRSVRCWHKPLGIGQKITLGYSAAIGVAALGITIGQVMGERFLEEPALKTLVQAHVEASLLIELKDAVLESQSDITPFLRNPNLLQTYYYHLLNRANQVQLLFQRLDVLVHHDHDTDGDRDALASFLRENEAVVNAYWQDLTLVLEPLGLLEDSETLSDLDARDLLLEFMNSPAALQLEQLVNDLDERIDEAQRTEQSANQALIQARQFNRQLTRISLVLSITAAIAIAAVISRQITRPLKAVTHGAEQAAAEANFDLKAPITTADEVGVLAESLNQLIQSVKDLLAEQATAQDKLTAYSHSLEQKVDERTQELHDKNLALQSTLQELQQTQIKMVQSEKMSSIGQMVAGVAHEINNPVNFIHGNLIHAHDYTQDLLRLVRLYQQAYPAPIEPVEAELEIIDLTFIRDDLPKLLQSMRVGTDRIREIVKSLRNFSRLDEAALKTVDIHEGIDSTLMILHNRLKPKTHTSYIEVIKDYGALPLVECYPSQLNQVFMNILANAIDALEEAALDRPSVRIQTQVLDGNRIEICLSDNGPGIPNAIQSRLFDPFFTTKPVGKGTGLGLSISYQIVTERHQGTLQCRSKPDYGAEFVIMLPIRQTI